MVVVDIPSVTHISGGMIKQDNHKLKRATKTDLYTNKCVVIDSYSPIRAFRWLVKMLSMFSNTRDAL